ncbi:lysylphosphatidylglycerol synthase domain-containing protein [Streptosporangium sp. KLBMP 9127]|nr:flippase-like domain-containing protein [Streptosporangium sp. KLBMP 9127]
MIVKLRSIISVVFGLAVVAFVVVAVREQDWTALEAIDVRRLLPYAGAAFLINALALWIGMLSWHSMLTGLGSPIGLWVGSRIYFVGFLAKFVPGRVWTLLANIRMGTAAGVTPARMTAVYLLSAAIGILTGALVGIPAAPAVTGTPGLLMVLAAVPIGVLLARPGLLHRMVSAVLRLLRRQEPQDVPSGRGVRLAIAWQSLSWAISGIHLWLLAVAVGAPPLKALAVCAGAFGLAVIIGHLTLLTPDGLGVREALLLAVLTVVLPLPAAGTVVVLSRLICTLSELTMAGTVLLVAHIRVRSRNEPEERGPWPVSTSSSSSTTTPPTSAV